MDNVFVSLLVFVLGWILFYLFAAILGVIGADSTLGIIFSIFYLCSVVTYFSLKIIEKLNSGNKK